MAYTNNDEQFELVKKWWQEHGMATIIIVVLAIAASFGWRFWQNYTAKKSAEASQIYEFALDAVRQNQLLAADKYIDELKQHYPRTPYASAVMLLHAQTGVNKNQLDQAALDLNWIIEHGKPKLLRQLAQLRLARIYLQQNKKDEALKLINQLDDNNAAVAEVKGDVYFAMARYAPAQAAYKKALANLPKNSTAGEMISMKLNQVQAAIS